MIPGLDEQERDIARGLSRQQGSGSPAFWVLADAEGGEGCIATGQGRDE